MTSAIAAPPRYGTILGPDGRTIACPRWAPAPDVLDARMEALKRSFFLVRIAGNDGLGELWRCKRCRGRHQYLTASCVERPFNGIDQVLYVMWQQAGDMASVRSLDPTQQRRHNAGLAIAREVVGAVPDLARHHPEMARRMARQTGMTPLDLEVGGVVVGRAEPIPRTLAQRLLDRINANRPIDGRLQVEGLVS